MWFLWVVLIEMELIYGKWNLIKSGGFCGDAFREGEGKLKIFLRFLVFVRSKVFGSGRIIIREGFRLQDLHVIAR